MFSDNSSFEMYSSVIMDCNRTDDKITLKCLYMQAEFAYIKFDRVSECRNYDHLKGNTISYIKAVDNRYEVHFVNESIDPTVIMASEYEIEWR